MMSWSIWLVQSLVWMGEVWSKRGLKWLQECAFTCWRPISPRKIWFLCNSAISCKWGKLALHFFSTQKTTAQAVKMSVIVNNSPTHDYDHVDDHAPLTYKMTLGFKLFTEIAFCFRHDLSELNWGKYCHHPISDVMGNFKTTLFTLTLRSGRAIGWLEPCIDSLLWSGDCTAVCDPFRGSKKSLTQKEKKVEKINHHLVTLYAQEKNNSLCCFFNHWKLQLWKRKLWSSKTRES